MSHRIKDQEMYSKAKVKVHLVCHLS